MPKKPKMYLGEVPADVYQRELEAYKERRKNSTSKRVRAQFTYNGKNYTIHKSSKGETYALKRSHERVQKEQTRRGREVGQEIRLTSIEQMMTDNYWEEANRRGLSVDHKIPIKHGGFSNAPWNLGLMEKSTNSAKGAKLGGNWTYEPFLESAPDGTVRFNIVARDQLLEETLKGTPQEQVSLPQTTATAPRQNLTPQSSAPQSKVTPPQAAPEPKVNMAPQVMSAETNGNGNGNGAYETNGNGNGNGGTYLNGNGNGNGNGGTYLNGNGNGNGHGNGNYAEGIANSTAMFGSLVVTAGAVGLKMLQEGLSFNP